MSLAAPIAVWQYTQTIASVDSAAAPIIKCNVVRVARVLIWKSCLWWSLVVDCVLCVVGKQYDLCHTKTVCGFWWLLLKLRTGAFGPRSIFVWVWRCCSLCVFDIERHREYSQACAHETLLFDNNTCFSWLNIKLHSLNLAIAVVTEPPASSTSWRLEHSCCEIHCLARCLSN